MKDYDVTITETLQRTVRIRAESPAEAEEIAEERHSRSEYVLDAGDFKGADFHAREREKKRDYEW